MVVRTPMTDLREHNEVKRISTPVDWEREHNIYCGATFNLVHNLTQMLYFRQYNKPSKIYYGCSSMSTYLLIDYLIIILFLIVSFFPYLSYYKISSCTFLDICRKTLLCYRRYYCDIAGRLIVQPIIRHGNLLCRPAAGRSPVLNIQAIQPPALV
jgi:hypothetical protein